MDDYRLLGQAVAACNPEDIVSVMKLGKAVCSLLFTCFMNLNWFIKAGLVKWDKAFWGHKQNLVRIWVAIYSFVLSVNAYVKISNKRDKSGADHRAKFESQLNVFKSVMDFLT